MIVPSEYELEILTAAYVAGVKSATVSLVEMPGEDCLAIVVEGETFDDCNGVELTREMVKFGLIRRDAQWNGDFPRYRLTPSAVRLVRERLELD